MDCLMVGPHMLQDMEQIVREVQKNLKVAQDRQKSYTDLKLKTTQRVLCRIPRLPPSPTQKELP